MRAGLVVTGVLGLGTVVVFAFAALTATLFPSGTVVAGNGGVFFGGPNVRGGMALPVPAPAIDVAPQVVTIDDGAPILEVTPSP